MRCRALSFLEVSLIRKMASYSNGCNLDETIVHLNTHDVHNNRLSLLSDQT